MVSFKETLPSVQKSLCGFSARLQTSYLVSWTCIELPLSPLVISLHHTLNRISTGKHFIWLQEQKFTQTRPVNRWPGIYLAGLDEEKHEERARSAHSNFLVKVSLSAAISRFLTVCGLSDIEKKTCVSTWRKKTTTKKCWCPITDQFKGLWGFFEKRMESGFALTSKPRDCMEFLNTSWILQIEDRKVTLSDLKEKLLKSSSPPSPAPTTYRSRADGQSINY